jgi:outer membrane protein OmpA-like peptidoglycan-associated protein/flagellar hook assembly protein FlgD
LPLPGAIASFPFASPHQLFGDDPRAAAFNPAAGADRELPTFGASAFAAFPTGRGSGFGGGASFGASVPGSWGTFSAVADAAGAADSLRGFPVPAGGSALLGLSKRASDRLALGVTVGAVAADGDRTAYGAYGGVGAELALPFLGPFGSDAFFSLAGIGPDLSPWKSYGPYVGATPLVGLRTPVVDSGGFSASLSALAAFPSFADAVLAAGAAFGVGKNLTVDLGWTFRVKETAAYTDGGAGAYLSAPRMIPTVSILLDASSFLRFGSYGASPALTLRQAGGGVQIAEASTLFSKGERDRTGPETKLELSGPHAVSPAQLKELRIPVSITDDSLLASWSIVVYEESGAAAYTVGNSVPDPSSRSALARIFSKRAGVRAPDSIVIPLGTLPADGAYSVRAAATDIHGNAGRPASIGFSVDRVSPAASASVAGPSIFSPNGDGVRDTLSIEQDGSVETEWIGSLVSLSAPNGERVVRSFSWTQGAPRTFVWDGTGDDGNPVPDGEYLYRLSAEDEAGNRGGAELRGIAVSATPTPVALRTEGRALSPDGDGLFDTVSARLDVPVMSGLESWTIEIVGDDGRAFHSWTGSVDTLAVLPETVVFDGRNSRGEVIPDGSWRFRLQASYANGNRPQAIGDDFIVDTKPPAGRARTSASSFAIDRGGSVVFFHDLSPNASWRGILSDERGSVVRTFPLTGDPVGPIDWNGIDDAGAPVAEGTYQYLAEGRSATGIVGRTAPISVRVESGGVSAALIGDRKVFSPRGGRVLFIPRIDRKNRAVSYELIVRSESAGQRAVHVQSGASVPPTSFIWNGRDDAGALLEDGTYLAELVVRYESGFAAKTEPIRVALDGTPPSASVSVSDPIFSPNGDGRLDSVRFLISASPEREWVGEIVDEMGRAIRSFKWNGRPPAELAWDGLRQDKVRATDGRYRLRLSAVDEAGSEAAVDSPAVALDARIPSATVTSDKSAFSPNGDSFADSVRFRATPSIPDGIVSRSFAVVDSAGRIVRSAAPASFGGELVWDGATDAGAAAADGVYVARIEARYAKGDVLSAESAPVVLDTAAPAIDLKIGPFPFSPDQDGENDTLRIDLGASDRSGIASWSLSIVDPEGFPFTQFSGRDLPPEAILWDGADLDGNLVDAAQDYSYTLRVLDKLGNAASASGKIPVDVFVLRDGDRLKIRVSSITFSPNTASMTTSDAEATARNAQVLDRIAAVLAKFPAYRIRVEGHAVNLSGSEREERTELLPLSLDRARAVVEALAERGIDRERLDAVGLGGREPLVPHGDLQFRWRNRRVEFILVR